MKKTVSLSLATLMLCCSAAAMAQAAVTLPYEATAVPFDGGFILQIPSSWNVFELSEEDIRSGILYNAGDGETVAMTVHRFAPEEAVTLEDIQKMMKADKSISEAEISEINGIRALGYRMDEDIIGVALIGVDGRVYDMAFQYMNEDAFAVAAMILTTMSVIEARIPSKSRLTKAAFSISINVSMQSRQTR